MADTQVSILITAIDEASQVFRSVLDNSESMASKLSKAGDTLGDLGRMSQDFTEPLAEGLKKSKNAAIDFESGMAEVRKTTGLSAAQTAELGNEIKKLSRTIPLTTKQLTDIGVAAGQSGVAMKDIPNYVKEISKASVALAVDTDKAGLAFGRLSNIYGMPNAEIPKLAAAINVLGDSSVASEKEILNVIMRTAALSKQANLTAKDSAALGASFVSLGMAPSVAATAINALLSRMTTAEIQSAKFQKGLSMIGMSGKELQNLTAKDGTQAIFALGSAIDKLDPQERAKAIGLMFGAEHSDNVGIFLDRMDVFKNALGSVANDQSNVNRYNEVFATQLGTTESKMQLLQNSFHELAIEIGTALLPAIKAFAAFLTPIINKVTEFAAKHPNIVRLGSALASLAISLGPLLFGLSAIAKAWGLFSAGIPIVAALSNKFLGVGNPISKMLNWLAGANQRLLGIGKASNAISPPDLMGKMGKLPKIEECLPVCICPEICDDFETKLRALAQQITYCIPICICPEDCEEGGKALPAKGKSPASTIGQNPLLPKAEENTEGTATIQPTQEVAQQASIANAQQLTAIFLAGAQQLAATQLASAQQLATTFLTNAQQLGAIQLANAQQLTTTFLTNAQQLAATQITSAQQLVATFLTNAQQLTATLLTSIQQIAATFLTNAQQLGAIQLASAQQAGLILVTSAQEVGATLLASIQGLQETLLSAAQQLGTALQLGAQEAGSIIVVSAQEAGSILVAAAQEAGAMLSGIIQEASSMLAEASSMLAASAQEVAIQSENAREVSAQRSSGSGFKNAALLGLGAAGIGGAVFGLSKVVGGIGGAVKGGIGALFGGVQSAAGALSMNAAKGAATLGATASKVVGGIGGAIGGAASGATGAIGGAIAKTGPIGQALTNTIGGAASTAGSAIGGAASNLAGAVGGTINNAVGAAKMGAGFAGGAIKGAASGALNAAGGAVKGAASGALSAAGGAAKSAASSALGAAGGAIKGAAGSALSAVGGTAGLAKAATAAAPIASAAAGIAAGSEKAQPTNTISKFTRSQSTETPASDLATQSTAAAKNNIVPLTRSSNESGKAIASGLAKGIESSKPQAELAAAGLAQSVSSYLPRSPAEKGPLSDLNKTGLGLTQEFVKGIDGSAIQNKFKDVMNPPSKFDGIKVGGNGGGSSNSAVYSPTYNLSGTQPENFIAELEKHDRQFVEWLQQTQERFNRGRY
jgi:TP901 family phage tail tape measure protein